MKYNLNHPQIKKLINHFKDDDKFNMIISSPKDKKIINFRRPIIK
jgi:acetone carboxylase gamma subunit